MNYKKNQLKNGLRIITAPMKGTEAVAVFVMVGVGSRYETEKQAGLSHFVEHMFFKGTKKRPSTLAISEELDSIGGEFNAFTGKDTTGYFAKVDAKHIDTALDVVSDIYLNSKIDQKELQKEKGTILQELNMYEDTPMRKVADVFEGLLYPKNSLGWDIVGNKDSVQSFSRTDFIRHMKQFYVANDTVICVAGKFEEKNVIRKISRYFSHMISGKKPSFKRVTEKQIEPQIKLKTKKTDQSHLILGVRAYDRNHKDRFVLALLAIILGGNMSSRLFLEVREKRGLAYYVKTNTETFEDCGYIATQAGVEHKKLGLAISTILTEYKKIASVRVSRKELQKAKDYIKGRMIMGMESSDEVAMFYIEQELLRKKIMTREEIFARIDKVSENDILRVAKEVFRKEKINLAVIGPHEEKKKLEKILIV